MTHETATTTCKGKQLVVSSMNDQTKSHTTLQNAITERDHFREERNALSWPCAAEINYIPSQKNISHSLSTDVQGNVLENTHMNHSVMYSTGVT